MTAIRPLNENNTRGLIRAALREDLAYYQISRPWPL